ncbi:hypothetical protein N9M09_03065 [Candidatus Poseidoniales archaeon]|nr:hypothetical protein [Candidatus Poseidoniales archaeon]
MHVGIPGWWSDGLIHLGKDPIMGPLIEQYGPHGLEGKGDLFNTLIRSIVGQQISVIAAESIWNRFVKLVGDVQPSNVLKFSKEEIAACGITRPKSGYILELAQSSKQLLEFPFDSSSIEEIRKHLIQFKGIGPWTAEMVMIFSLCLPDIYSPKDIGLVNAIKKLNTSITTMDEAEEMAKQWSPYRTMACWYLWCILDPIPVEY